MVPAVGSLDSCAQRSLEPSVGMEARRTAVGNPESGAGDMDGDCAWGLDSWDSAREAAARLRLAATGPCLPAHRLYHHLHRGWRHWDAYYLAHGDTGFKDRHWLAKDFPQLFAGRPGVGVSRTVTLLELGCGVGNAFFPLLAQHPRLVVTAFDLSKRAIGHIAAHPLSGSGRVCAFSHNAAHGGTAVAVQSAHAAFVAPARSGDAACGGVEGARDGPGPAVTAASALYRHMLPLSLYAARADAGGLGEGGAARKPGRLFVGFEAALVLFMASAMPHASLASIFHEAATCLAPGGVLLFRDYAIYDEAELRFRPGRRLDQHLFARCDGTLAAFFSIEDVTIAAARAGLEVVETRYLYRRNSNRATGQQLRRIFLHAVLRAPGSSAALAGTPIARAAAVCKSSGAQLEEAGAQVGASGVGETDAWLEEMSEYEWLRDVCGWVGPRVRSC